MTIDHILPLPDSPVGPGYFLGIGRRGWERKGAAETTVAGSESV